MAGRRSRRSGTGTFDAVPDLLASGPGHIRTRPVRATIGRALLVATLILVSLVDAVWLVAFLGTLIFDPSDINGWSDVVFFLVVQIILTGIWLPLHRGVRGGKPGPNRPPGRSARRLFQRAIRPAPHGRHTLASNPIGPRTALSPWQLVDASWLTRTGRPDVGLPEDGTLARLAVAEQALGNALYELDLRRGSHALTRERISALRVTGLEASAWLTTRAELAVVMPRSSRSAATKVEDGVRRYTDLARQAQDFLAGRAGVAQLDSARESLARSSSTAT